MPAVLADDAAHAHEVLVQHCHQDFRTERLAERRERHQVGEQDRDLLLLRVDRSAACDDAFDHRARGEAGEGRLQVLQLLGGHLQTLLQPATLRAQAMRRKRGAAENHDRAAQPQGRLEHRSGSSVGRSRQV